MPAIKRIVLPANPPRVYQNDLWSYMENGGKRGLAVCHRRWGKDELCLNWAAVAAHERVGTYWHMLPEQAQGKKAIWNAVDEETGRRRIDQAFPENLRARTNEQEMFIQFRCGSTWQVVGSDNYNSLVGSPPVGVVASEWALANPAAWVYLSPILEKNGGWALFPYTPRGKNHGYKFWQLSQKSPDWFGVRQTVDQTGIFTPKQLATIKGELIDLYGEDDGENLFQQEYYCSFDVAIIGAYYGKIIARLEQGGRVTRVPFDPNFPVYSAWDLGLDDATAIWFFQLIGREVRVIDYRQYRNKALVDIAKEIVALPYVFVDHFWPHDGDTRELTYAKTRKETCENGGLRPIRIGEKRDPTERINAVRQLLPKCVFDSGQAVEKGLEALRSYRVDYDDKNATPRKTPKHDWASHPADAFGEAAMQLPLGAVTHQQTVALGTNYDVLEDRNLPGLWVPDRYRQSSAGMDDYDWEAM
jgi:hypothetical protein